MTDSHETQSEEMSHEPAPESYDHAQEPARSAPQRPAPQRVARREETGPPAKSPLLAGFLSLVPGMGNIYNGLYARGLVFFLLVVSLFYTAVASGDGSHLALLIPSLIFVWLFNIFDAYRQATLINWGWEEDEAVYAHRNSGALAAGIALFVIGLYGFLHQFFDIDLSALLEHWYIIIMAVGGWLIYQAWREKTST